MNSFTIYIYAFGVLLLSVPLLFVFHILTRNVHSAFSTEVLLHRYKVNTFILLFIILWLSLVSDHVDMNSFGFQFHGFYYICFLGFLIALADLFLKHFNKKRD